jgi:N-acyl homoserine lactone hydrolase
MNKETEARKLYLMQLSTVDVPLPDGRTKAMVLPCYLIEMHDHMRILVDTGIAEDAPVLPGSPKAENKKNVLEHLDSLGLGPDDIDIVVCTHFDIDHAGYHDAFIGAEYIVQREHYEIAKHGHERFEATRKHWNYPELKYRTIRGDHEVLPGVTLLATGGHVPGHQSVMVDLPWTGKVLLAIDAVMFASQFVPDRKPGPMDVDPGLTVASTRKLIDIAEREKVALTVFGHDGEQWKGLRKCAEFYE